VPFQLLQKKADLNFFISSPLTGTTSTLRDSPFKLVLFIAGVPPVPAAYLQADQLAVGEIILLYDHSLIVIKICYLIDDIPANIFILE
jgi:hypothetical protein